jgi:hypothetical protein
MLVNSFISRTLNMERIKNEAVHFLKGIWYLHLGFLITILDELFSSCHTSVFFLIF